MLVRLLLTLTACAAALAPHGRTACAAALMPHARTRESVMASPAEAGADQPEKLPDADQPERLPDAQIKALTDKTTGVNALIGRPIKTPSDWMGARMEDAKLEAAELGDTQVVGFERGAALKAALVILGEALDGWQ